MCNIVAVGGLAWQPPWPFTPCPLPPQPPACPPPPAPPPPPSRGGDRPGCTVFCPWCDCPRRPSPFDVLVMGCPCVCACVSCVVGGQGGGLVSGILQPAICLQLGDSLLFDLTANPGRYPVREPRARHPRHRECGVKAGWWWEGRGGGWLASVYDCGSFGSTAAFALPRLCGVE